MLHNIKSMICYQSPIMDILKIYALDLEMNYSGSPEVIRHDSKELVSLLEDIEYSPEFPFNNDIMCDYRVESRSVIWKPKAMDITVCVSAFVQCDPGDAKTVFRKYKIPNSTFTYYSDENIIERQFGNYGADKRYIRFHQRLKYRMQMITGTPLPFEQTDAYRKRAVKDRLTEEMICDYMRKLGYPVDEERFYEAEEVYVVEDR